jgi:hypothetical protein
MTEIRPDGASGGGPDEPERPGPEGSPTAGRDVPEASPTAGRDVEPAPADGPAPRRTGSVSFQDPENTVPREPTLAEKRARERAERDRQAADEAWWDEQARAAKRRKRLLVGGAVGIGLVAVIAVSYSASHPGGEEARCVGPDNVVVSDNNCVTPAADSGYYHGGGFFPIFIGGGGRQYHYTYGGSGDLGQVATGGTTVPPRTGTVRTTSGRTIDVGGSGSSSGSGSASGSDPDSGSSASRTGSSTIKRGGFGVGKSGSGGS